MADDNNRYYKAMLLIGVIIITGIFGINLLNFNNNYNPNVDGNYELEYDIEEIQQNRLKFGLDFNGSRAWNHLVNQVNIGFRFPNSSEIELTRNYIIDTLNKFEWQVELHNFTYNDIENVNILAFPKNSNRQNITLFGAHYDTRWEASRDVVLANKNKPILGANDGASGVAILLEYAEIFKDRTDTGLLFIDAEDQGNLRGWNYIAGSKEFVKDDVLNSFFPNGKNDIKNFVLFDMIGDWDLNIKKELNSDLTLINEIWLSAKDLNYSKYFVPKLGYSMLDDHIPFKNIGIPSIDLIDFDYVDASGNNLHHTISDNLDNVKEKSLWIVGQTIEHWIKNKENTN